MISQLRLGYDIFEFSNTVWISSEYSEAITVA